MVIIDQLFAAHPHQGSQGLRLMLRSVIVAQDALRDSQSSQCPRDVTAFSPRFVPHPRAGSGQGTLTSDWRDRHPTRSILGRSLCKKSPETSE